MAEVRNIVLVHGAWGDGSHWRHVIPALRDRVDRVVAAQNPLTSLGEDISRTRRLVESLEGPTLLVGHAYGGAVISGAGNAENVVGLVYVAAFAPDRGESLSGITARADPSPGSSAVTPDADGFLWLAEDRFHDVVCQDLTAEEALVLAVAQRPVAGRCFVEPTLVPAWKAKPSWYQVSTADRMIPPDLERWMADRLNPRDVLELDTSHASLVSRPERIAELVKEAISDA